MKFYDCDEWAESLVFFRREDADDYASSLRAYCLAVEDAIVASVERRKGAN